jgi:transcription antitermination factor NusG
MALAPKDQWFVVHVLSGQEQKVKDNIDRRIITDEMSDLVFEVLIPTERVQEIKRGKKTETTRKFFPGYLIINMHLLDDNNQLVEKTWYFIKDTAGVLGFAGTKDRPIPMRPKEVEGLLAQIRDREDTRLDLHDSARMSERDLTPGEERWGVAVWEDVDPRIDFFSIYVRGLTNAIRWRPRADATFAADSVPMAGEEHVLESLRLDFWRPGDDATSLDDEMSVGHAGMYERRTIGSRVLEALGRGRQTASAPREGLEQLGLTWEEILDPPAAVKAAASVDRETPPSLVPLTKVVNALARLQPPAARPAAIRTLFGGVGEEWFEELVRGLSAPLDEERGALRRGMLDRCGVSEEDVANRPLESVVKVLAALDATTPAATRRSATVALFGAAALRLDSLVHELDLARARAVLDDMDFDRRPVLAGGALTAYDTMLTVFGAETDAAKRARMVTGLLGAEEIGRAHV